MLCVGTTLLLSASHPALGESEWLESRRLSMVAVRALCEQASDIRQLARMQMISTGDARWRRLSRQELVMETAVMGVPPLDPDRCYVIVRAGPKGDGERRAFEVRDFAVSPERTSVFIIGRAYDPPAAAASPRILCEATGC